MARTVYCCDEDGKCGYRDTIDEAMCDCLDEMSINEWPTELTVYGFQPAVPKYKAEDLVDLLIESLDEDYIHIDASNTIATPNMLDYAKVFLDDFMCEYQGAAELTYEVADSVEVEVLPWVRAHKPHWLAEKAEHVGKE